MAGRFVWSNAFQMNVVNQDVFCGAPSLSGGTVVGQEVGYGDKKSPLEGGLF